jgi:site-specific recombinase XerD
MRLRTDGRNKRHYKIDKEYYHAYITRRTTCRNPPAGHGNPLWASVDPSTWPAARGYAGRLNDAVAPNISIPVVVSTPEASPDGRLIEIWLHGRSPHTQRAYAADVARLLSRTGKPLAALTLADLQSFADSLAGLSPASRYRALSAVKSLLAFAHRTGYLPFDVGGALRLPIIRGRLAERILPEAGVHRMLSLEPNERNRAILTLLYASGVRVSELCGLRWRDVQASGDSAQITVFGKGGKTRAIRLPASVWKLLADLRAGAGDGAPVFRSRKKGGALMPVAVLRVVRRAARRAGIDAPVSPHWLRHAHASHALDRGAPIHLVQATLGHASITTTGRYLHARPADSSSRFLGL